MERIFNKLSQTAKPRQSPFYTDVTKQRQQSTEGIAKKGKKNGETNVAKKS